MKQLTFKKLDRMKFLITLDADTVQRLELLKNLYGVTRNALIEKIINDYLSKQKTID